MYQVVASDLDGTLLSPDHTFVTTLMWGKFAIIWRLSLT